MRQARDLAGELGLAERGLPAGLQLRATTRATASTTSTCTWSAAASSAGPRDRLPAGRHLSQARSTPEPTEIAGRYQVVQKLGAGAFGTVYKAKDKILGRMVAIKTIRLEGLAAAGASLDELIDRFKREAQVSAQLKHPNIVTIYDIGEADGLSYLAMEFIDGVGLDRVIANDGPAAASSGRPLLAAQVADALDFAHTNNVVHRDIKPANIMIEAGDRVKVTDFGIAKVTDSGDHLTMTGSLLGTPSYMSPEQARGSALDGRSDLFAVGCDPLRDARRARRRSAATPSPASSSRSSPRSRRRSREMDPGHARRDGAHHRQRAGQGAGGALPDAAASWPTTCWR